MAKKKPQPKTKLQKQVAKEINRITKTQAKLRERGYHFKKTYKYNPKNASKRELERLKKIKTKQLQEAKTTTYTGAGTGGKRVSGAEGAKAERSQAAKKRERAKRTKREEQTIPDVKIIEEIRDIVETKIKDFTQYRYHGEWHELRDLIPEKLLFHHILDYVEENLTHEMVTYYQSIKGELETLAERIGVSDGEEVEHSLAQFTLLLKGAPLTTKEKKELGEIVDSLDKWL